VCYLEAKMPELTKRWSNLSYNDNYKLLYKYFKNDFTLTNNAFLKFPTSSRTITVGQP
jgi:hypothetical protein